MCLFDVSEGQYCQKSVVKSLGFGKKIKKWMTKYEGGGGGGGELFIERGVKPSADDD